MTDKDKIAAYENAGPEDEETKKEMDCAEHRCGHHPQYDCDKHHPNPVLARALRSAWAKIADLSKRKDLTKEDRQSLTAVFGFEAGLGQVEAEFKKRAERAEGLVRKLAVEMREVQRLVDIAAIKEGAREGYSRIGGVVEDVLALVPAELR